MGLPDSRGALWHAAWLGELFRQGVSFALQFAAPNLITPQVDEQGKARPGLPFYTKGTYWAAWLWRHTMGDAFVGSDVSGTGATAVRAYATRSQSGVSLMLLNTDPDESKRVEVAMDGLEGAVLARLVRLSRREYFWLNGRPDAKPYDMLNPALWDRGPAFETIDPAALRNLELVPESVTVLEFASGKLPRAPSPSVTTQAVAPNSGDSLELALPASLYAGDSIEGWAFARRGVAPQVEALPSPPGSISVTGPVRVDREKVRLSEGAGRFMVTTTGAGQAEIAVSAGPLSAKRKLSIIESIPRPTVFWDFEKLPARLKSDWKYSVDGNARPNQGVLRVDVGDFDPSKHKKRELLIVGELPGRDRLAKENIRGVVFDLKVSPDWVGPADAIVRIVMQSPANYWMVIGTVALAGHADWRHHELVTDAPASVAAMPQAYNVWFVLETKSRVRGSIYLDQVGLMVR